MSFTKVTPDLKDPRQNEFVQDWLCAFRDEIPTDQQDYDMVDVLIEAIQEIYNPRTDGVGFPD